jgi:hypothetical protein
MSVKVALAIQDSTLSAAPTQIAKKCEAEVDKDLSYGDHECVFAGSDEGLG